MDAVDDQLNALLSQVDTLFEPSPALRVILTSHEHELLSESDDGKATTDLIRYVVKLLRSLKGRRELDEILNCHPRLGAQKVDSAHSQSEQKSLSGTGSSMQQNQEESKRLNLLNDEYEARFPGLRYVVFVNGRSRATIMHDMESRIARGDIEKEREEAIQAMGEIAQDRLSKMY